MQSMTYQLISKLQNTVPKTKVDGYSDYIIIELDNDKLREVARLQQSDNYNRATKTFKMGVNIPDLIRLTIGNDEISDFISKMKECIIDGELKTDMCFGDMEKVYKLLTSIKNSDLKVYADGGVEVDWEISRGQDLAYVEVVYLHLKNPEDLTHLYLFFGAKSRSSRELVCLV